MTPAELHTLLLGLGEFGLGAVVAAIVAILLLKHYAPSYLAEKGKNLATREDVAAITNEVERVRHQYGALVEELKARHQLRMAALDRRLQAHQEAFTLWRNLISEPVESGAAVIACQTWWEQNCLYLEPNVRQAFVEAYMNAHLRNDFIRVRAEAHFITDAWAKVMAFPNILFASVQLPAMSELEVKAVQAEMPVVGGAGG